jgi:hypothetical protein
MSGDLSPNIPDPIEIMPPPKQTPGNSDELTHAYQYRMLREELMENVREIRRTELLAAVATGVMYAWLFSNVDKIEPHYVWYGPTLIILIAALRTLQLMLDIRRTAGYLLRIEEHTFGSKVQKLPGWENYIKPKGRIFFRPLDNAAAIIWAGSIAVTLLIPKHVPPPSKHPPPSAPLSAIVTITQASPTSLTFLLATNPPAAQTNNPAPFASPPTNHAVGAGPPGATNH